MLNTTRRIVLLSLCSLLALSNRGFAQGTDLKAAMEALEGKFQHHAGLMLYDPEKRQVLFDYKSDKYFTPASNTKIFTLYTSFQLLGDSIPGLYYVERGDSLIIWGTGDPSLLYENVVQGKVLNFLQNTTKDIYLSFSNFHDQHYGPNWAWDDFSYYYQVEKTSFPLYGNYLILERDSGDVEPVVHNRVMGKYLRQKGGDSDHSPLIRDYGVPFTALYDEEDSIFRKEIPFKYTPSLAAELLSDTLQRPVHLVEKVIPPDKNILYSVPTDSLYRVLMQTSDNFIAEQLLLVCAGIISDSLKSDIAIRQAKNTFLSDLPDEPIWEDGSGLSRYNLFTPRSIVTLWDRMYRDIPRERLFSLLATGGLNGTISKWYKAKVPYIYGKTGTLRNNHTLSGYLITSRGKVLIFSFMNSNYPVESSDIKKEMERILIYVRDKY